MAIASLAGLSRAARAAWPIIRRGVREGLSANAIQRVLQEQGLGVRRATILDLVGYERSYQATGGWLRNLPRKARPDPRRLPVAISKLKREFSFLVKIGMTRDDDDELVNQYVTVVSDELPSREAIEAAAETLGVAGRDRYQLEVTSIQLVGGKRAGLKGTL